MANDRARDSAATASAMPAALEATRTQSPSEAGPAPAGAAASHVPLHSHVRYEILHEHGRGGLGRVSRARDRELGRDIAIKELISRGAVNELRFLREALITARLEHPGIVPVYEAGCWADGTPFYAMKLVAGRSLRELLVDRAAADERLALLHHVIAVADAIAYAHGRNIIHRDLKPANVIVGDFGETIVIDWGLAKDLSASDDVPIGAGGAVSPSDNGLTGTGSVLGTPAYMPPEQQRGEPVDQRADVYAIGAMLWELCTAEKLPPAYTRQRRTILRRAGIDRDLASIVIKAVDPDPELRYRDAGALATDLKAFKAGARVAAREYSALAMFAHWMARHRAQALSFGGSGVLIIVGIALYLSHVAAERDRAAEANNALILEHAELLLHSDPAAAIDTIERYTGSDSVRQAMLRAEALGRGVPRYRARPHSHAILAIEHLSDGTMLTNSIDGALAKTSMQGVSRVVARGAAPAGSFARAAARGWVAYPCQTTMICVLDVQTELPLPPPPIPPMPPLAGIAWSPSGELLAALSTEGEIVLWRMAGTVPTLHGGTRVAPSRWLGFIDDHTLATRSREGVQVFHLEPAGGLGAPIAFAIPGVREAAPDVDHHLLAVSTTGGALVLIDVERNQIAQRATLCNGQLNSVSVLAGHSTLAYACQSGDVGMYDIAGASATVVLHIVGGAAVASASADGRYLIAGGNSGELAIHDFVSGMDTRYLGHTDLITAVSPPSQEFPYIASGDVSGHLRLWPVPDTPVRAIITTRTWLRAAPLAGRDLVVAVDDTSTIRWAGPDAVGETGGHNPELSLLVTSTGLPRLIAFGWGDELELWSFDDAPSHRTMHGLHGAVTDAMIASDDAEFLVGSRDGSVVAWSPDGARHRELAEIHEPVWFLRRFKRAGGFAVGGRTGTLWTFHDGSLHYLGHEPGLINSVVGSPDGRWLVTATFEGIMRWYDLAGGGVSTSLSPQPSSEFLFFSPDSATLASATHSTISLTDAAPGEPSAPRWSWRQVTAAVGYFTFSSDSQWFAAVGEHGGIWFNRRGDRRWVYLATGDAQIARGYFFANDSKFVATEPSGRVLQVDMRAAVFQ